MLASDGPLFCLAQSISKAEIWWSSGGVYTLDDQQVSAPFDALEEADDATTETRYLNARFFVSKLLALDGPLFRLAQRISRAETWWSLGPICPPDIQQVSAPFDGLEDADDATTDTRYLNARFFVSKLLASDGPLFRLAQSISRAETWWSSGPICPPDIQQVSVPFDALEDADDATTETSFRVKTAGFGRAALPSGPKHLKSWDLVIVGPTIC
jgi:hypothetical protein